VPGLTSGNPRDSIILPVKKLSTWVSKKNPFTVKLEPFFPIKGVQKDERWRLLINTTVEGDL
jgi:hypothetical protein